MGGVVGGAGNATPKPTPTLNVFPPSPPPLATGQDRFIFTVLDRSTRRTLANVCIAGSPYATTCGPSEPHTNASGQYWFDMPPNSAAYAFFFFLEPDYYVSQTTRTAVPFMGSVSITVFMTHR